LNRRREALARFVASLSDEHAARAAPARRGATTTPGSASPGRVIEVVTGKTFQRRRQRPRCSSPSACSLAFTRVGDIVTHRFALGHRVAPDGGLTVVRPFTLGSTLRRAAWRCR